MLSQNTRIALIVVGTVVISGFLGSGAIKRQLKPAAAAQPAVLISLTPSQLPIASRTHTPTLRPTRTPSSTPTRTSPPTRTPSPTLIPSSTPGPTPDAKASTREVKVPIVMYHHVGALVDKPDQIRIGLTVLPDNFEAQLKFFKQRGYESVDFYQMYYAITLGWPLPKKPIVFTFDDAYRDVYQFAFPIMKRYGYTGTVFVPTQFIDEGRADYMTWNQLMEMSAAGWRLEPHTKTHVEVDGRGRDFLIYEIYGSMETLRYHLGYQPRFFAYPSGEYDDNAIAMLKEVGYWGAVTTDSSWYHRLSNAYTWGRVRIGGQYVMRDIANLMGEKYP